MSFGVSYSLVYVDCFDWVHTILYIRVIRTIIGAILVTGLYGAFIVIPADDNITKYFFHYLLPCLVGSFFIYGVFPVIC